MSRPRISWLRIYVAVMVILLLGMLAGGIAAQIDFQRSMAEQRRERKELNDDIDRWLEQIDRENHLHKLGAEREARKP